jgi:glycosyltransferase involved in cell wall biosynthesis
LNQFYLIVGAVYPPEPVISGRNSADLVAELVRRGHRVRVVAPYPSRPLGRRYPGYPRRLYWNEPSPQGYWITRCLAATSSHSSLLSRLVENLSFGLSAAWLALWMQPRPQTIYANTWPLFAQALLCWVARLRRIPLVLGVQDLYPESLAAQGRLRPGSWLFRCLQALDRWNAASSRALMVIARSFEQVYRQQRRIPASKIQRIPIWIDDQRLLAELAALPPGENSIRRRLGISPDTFLFVYAGNIGAAAGLEAVLEALQGAELPAQFMIAGEGPRLEACRRLAGELPPGMVHFISPWAKEDTAAVLASADAFLLPTFGEQAFASLPSKLAAYQLAARPVLAIASQGTDLARAIDDSGCGWLVPPGSPEALRAALRQACRVAPDERARRGVAGREYALAHFSRAACLPRLVELVEDCI